MPVTIEWAAYGWMRQPKRHRSCGTNHSPHVSRAIWSRPIILMARSPSRTSWNLLVSLPKKDVIVCAADTREQSLWLASDNRAAVAWSQMGSSISIGARAYSRQLYALLYQCYHHNLARRHYMPWLMMPVADGTSLMSNYSLFLIQFIHRHNPGCCTLCTPQ